ncbi:hypothetical protein DH86_00004336 [Scytalidium sp. 3C]|nr:hypothetical protein DH86_00004336 [Scytalidium sp. 3C]
MVLSQIQSSIASLSNRLQRMEDQILSLRTDLRRQSLNTMPQGEKSPASISLQGSTSSQLTSGKWSLSISPGKYFIEDLTGATIFLGSKSDPPSILGCRQVSSDDTLDASILDQLAPKTYPFANLWTPDIRLSEIISALPDDAGIMRRPELDGDEDLKQGIDISWLSLLFAILACGVQFSDDQVKERDLKSKVFGLFFDDFSQLREFKAN